MAEKALDEVVKPSLYTYLDYREYLKDWLLYKSSLDSDFSMRKFCAENKIPVSLLSRILNRNMALSLKTFDRIKMNLELNSIELRFLFTLVQLSEAPNQAEREKAFSTLFTFPKFRDNQKNEVQSFKYLNHWCYPAICHLADLPDFKEDPRWIKSRLIYKESITTIKEALTFLKENGFLEYDKHGVLKPTSLNFNCDPGIFSLSMSNYYSQMFELASECFFTADRDKRRLRGHTISIDEQDIEHVKNILEEASSKIREITEKKKPVKSVYQVCLAAFPLTKDIEDEK